MTTALLDSTAHLDSRIAPAVRDGLTANPKQLTPWLLYDEAGSCLFDAITALPEYYLTRTERAILSANSAAILARAAGKCRLQIAELGSGSADKTRLLLSAAIDRQGEVLYEPVDVSASALAAAGKRLRDEFPGVEVMPRVMDYTEQLRFAPAPKGTRRLVLYIGSSIGNFEPVDAAKLLGKIKAALEPGDGLLLGVDLVKDQATLLAAYNDAAGVTAAFNLNLLARINRELGAGFRMERFAHKAVWNREFSRMEMHLVSLTDQRVEIPALGIPGPRWSVEFRKGETIHTENSYKYTPEQAAAMLYRAGFATEGEWSDERGWFKVCLGRVP